MKAKVIAMAYTWNSTNRPDESYFIIGNGFDIECGLPTRYVDFLNTISEVKENRDRLAKRLINHKLGWPIQYNKRFQMAVNDINSAWIAGGPKYIKSFLDMIDNFWYNHFSDLLTKKYSGEEWIDFEHEIQRLVFSIEEKTVDPNRNDRQQDSMKRLVLNEEDEGLSDDLSPLINRIYNDEYDKRARKRYGVYKELSYGMIRDYMETDLVEFIRALDLYFRYYSNSKVPEITQVIEEFLNVVKSVSSPHIITFNYTDTLERLLKQRNYDQIELYKRICYVHGRLGNELVNNTMILGMGDGKDDTLLVDAPVFERFRKSNQRNRRKSDSKFNSWIKNINATNSRPRQLEIFGHSLSRIDSSLIAPLIMAKNMRTVIFYHSDDTDLKSELNRYIGEKTVKVYENRGVLKFISKTDISRFHNQINRPS